MPADARPFTPEQRDVLERCGALCALLAYQLRADARAGAFARPDAVFDALTQLRHALLDDVSALVDPHVDVEDDPAFVDRAEAQAAVIRQELRDAR